MNAKNGNGSENNDETKNNSGKGSNEGPSRFGDSNDASDDMNNAINADGAASNASGAGAGESAEATAKAEVAKWKNEYLYLRAEFDNFKKQVIKERSDLRKYGSERLVSDLLNVLDIFDTALASDLTPENTAVFRKGIEMTANELRSVLNRHGVTEIASHGHPFDPAHHEALSSEETADMAPGMVTRVFKKPYRLHDRVVRPGQVVVAKPKS